MLVRVNARDGLVMVIVLPAHPIHMQINQTCTLHTNSYATILFYLIFFIRVFLRWAQANMCVCVWVSVSVEWLWEMSTKWYNVGCRLCLCGCGVVINAFGAHTRLIQGKYLCAEMRALCMCEWELLWRFECLLLIINVLAFGGWTSNIWF